MVDQKSTLCWPLIYLVFFKLYDLHCLLGDAFMSKRFLFAFLGGWCLLLLLLLLLFCWCLGFVGVFVCLFVFWFVLVCLCAFKDQPQHRQETPLCCCHGFMTRVWPRKDQEQKLKHKTTILPNFQSFFLFLFLPFLLSSFLFFAFVLSFSCFYGFKVEEAERRERQKQRKKRET